MLLWGGGGSSGDGGVCVCACLCMSVYVYANISLRTVNPRDIAGERRRRYNTRDEIYDPLAGSL